MIKITERTTPISKITKCKNCLNSYYLEFKLQNHKYVENIDPEYNITKIKMTEYENTDNGYTYIYRGPLYSET